MTKSRALRLYKLELTWGQTGGGWKGRNEGTRRAARKAIQHQRRLEKLRILAGER